MTATQRYRAQHAELTALILQITVLLQDSNISKKATEIRNLISSLAGKLSIHLAIETKNLYPKLMAHSDPDIRALSKRYSDEMTAMSNDFTRFNQRWLTAALIEKDPANFIADTTRVMNAIQSRIDREKQGLYKLVDDLDGKD